MLGVRPSSDQKQRSVQTHRPPLPPAGASATDRAAAAVDVNCPREQISSVACAVASPTSTWYLPDACAQRGLVLRPGPRASRASAVVAAACFDGAVSAASCDVDEVFGMPSPSPSLSQKPSGLS